MPAQPTALRLCRPHVSCALAVLLLLLGNLPTAALAAATQDAALAGAAWPAGPDPASQPLQLAFDYGDAPDPSDGTGPGNYNTRAADNGPSHAIVANLWLGAVGPDGDEGNLQNSTATADDVMAVDDEEMMVAMPAILTVSTGVQFDARFFNDTGQPATLACWIDFNQNGVFTDPGERQAATVGSAPALQTIDLTFSGFAPPTFGFTYLRCRLAASASEVDLPTGPAWSGEVEDHLVQVAEPPTAVTLASLSAGTQTAQPQIDELQGRDAGPGRQPSALLAGVLVCLAWAVRRYTCARRPHRPA